MAQFYTHRWGVPAASRTSASILSDSRHRSPWAPCTPLRSSSLGTGSSESHRDTSHLLSCRGIKWWRVTQRQETKPNICFNHWVKLKGKDSQPALFGTATQSADDAAVMMSNNMYVWLLKVVHTLQLLTGSSSPLAGCASSGKPSWVYRLPASHLNGPEWYAALSGQTSTHCVQTAANTVLTSSVVYELKFKRSFTHTRKYSTAHAWSCSYFNPSEGSGCTIFVSKGPRASVYGCQIDPSFKLDLIELKR